MRVLDGEDPPYRPVMDVRNWNRDGADGRVAELMKTCWEESPLERPDFNQIKKYLRQINQGKYVILTCLLLTLSTFNGNKRSCLLENTCTFLPTDNQLQNTF